MSTGDDRSVLGVRRRLGGPRSFWLCQGRASGRSCVDVPRARSRTELRKVSFPSRDEVIGTTIVVIVTQLHLRGLPVRRRHADQRGLYPASSGCSLTEPGRARPSSGERKWYIVHTYSGFEERVRQHLRQRADALGMGSDRRNAHSDGDRGRVQGRQEARDAAQVLPRLHPGRDGDERGDLARGEEHAQGHRFRRHRQEADAALRRRRSTRSWSRW